MRVRPLERLTTLSVGHATHDQYGPETLVGGCAVYGARAFRALGARSLLVTVTGEDFACDGELDGVEVARGMGPRTTRFENTYPEGGPRHQWVDALAPPVRPDLLPTDWAHPDILFLSPVCGEVDIAPWLAAVDAPLVGLSLQGAIKEQADTGGGRRSTVRARPLGLTAADLRRIDVVFASDEDLALFGTESLLGALCSAASVVVVTSGASGSTVFAGGNVVRVGVHPATEVDPTGAGDTFAASFLFAMARREGIVDAARFASAAASIVVEGKGGTQLERLRESTARAKQVPVLDAPGARVSA